jgi:hypothetical protein
MSLSLFALKNNWHRNGMNDIKKEFGGLPKSPTEL